MSYPTSSATNLSEASPSKPFCRPVGGGHTQSLGGPPIGVRGLGSKKIAWLSLLVLGGAASSPQVWATGESEYLKSESPTASDLKQVRSSTDGVGEIPESLLDQYDAYTLLPRVWLPKWRQKCWPKTGNPFVDDLKFSVDPRFYYFHRDLEKQGIQESAAIGGSLSMESGWLYDTFKLGFTGYTSQKLYGPSDRDGVGLLAPDQQGYSALGEAYLDIKYGNNLLRAGRTRIDLPYINALDFRMTPQTFEAVGFRSQQIENFKLGMGHIFSVKTRTSTDFESMSDIAGVNGSDRGVSAASMRYDFSEHDFIAMTEQYGWDMFNTFYVEGEKLFELSDRWQVRLGAQFTDQRSVGDELLGDFETQTLGFKSSVQYCNLILSFAATWTADDTGVVKPWGGTPAYNSMIIQDFDRAGETSYRVGLTYDFEPHGLEGVSVDTSWVTGDTPENGSDASPDQTEFDFTIDYRPTHDLYDGVWWRFRYALNERDDGHDIEDIRVILNYSYTF